MFSLSGTSALVTGGNRGIGRAVVRKLAQAGALVIVASRSSDASEATVKELEREGYSALGIALDVRSSSSVSKAFEGIRRHVPGPDILVNNAGINRRGSMLELTVEDWQEVLDTNLVGVFRCVQQAVPHMINRGWGRIVNIASQAGVVGVPRLAAYGASKAGLIHMTKVLALELAEVDITVNAVAPAYVVTDMTASQVADKAIRRQILASIPKDAFITPEDVAAAVVYLASQEARMVTGHTLLVDGGWVAQ